MIRVGDIVSLSYDKADPWEYSPRHAIELQVEEIEDNYFHKIAVCSNLEEGGSPTVLSCFTNTLEVRWYKTFIHRYLS